MVNKYKIVFGQRIILCSWLEAPPLLGSVMKRKIIPLLKYSSKVFYCFSYVIAIISGIYKMLLRRCTSVFSSAVRSPLFAPRAHIGLASSSSRGFSEAAVHATTADSSDDSADIPSGTDYVKRHKSAVGREYHELLTRSRGVSLIDSCVQHHP